VKDIPREKPKKSGKPKPEAEPQWHEPAAVTEEDIVVEENIMLLELGEPSDAGNLARLNKNAARKAYGGASVRRETSGSGIKSKG
jgi:hypothetical protein